MCSAVSLSLSLSLFVSLSLSLSLGPLAFVFGPASLWCTSLAAFSLSLSLFLPLRDEAELDVRLLGLLFALNMAPICDGMNDGIVDEAH